MKKLGRIGHRWSRRKLVSLLVETFVVSFLIFGMLNAVHAYAALGAYEGNNEQTASSQPITGGWVVDFNYNKANYFRVTLYQKLLRVGLQMYNYDRTADELTEDFQGLKREQEFGAQAPVVFRIVRDAGTFTCEGTFGRGTGTGRWRLSPNQNFIATMHDLGYDKLTDDEIATAALYDVTVKFVKDLATAGYQHPSFGELVRARTRNLTIEYIREMKASGFPHPALSELIRARFAGVEAGYIKEMAAIGFAQQPLDTFSDLRHNEVTLQFIIDLRSEGYTSVSPESAIRLKRQDIDGAFIRRAKAQGYQNATIDQLLRLRREGVVK